DGKFLLWRLSSSDVVDFACSQYEGDRPRVKFDQLGKFFLKLPPRLEQTRIVQKLEELLSGLDAGVAELKAAQKKLVQFRQSVLKAAMDGSLTATWRAGQAALPEHARNAETGEQFLKRILEARRAQMEAIQREKFVERGKSLPSGWQGKYLEPLAPAIDNSLPEGWAQATLEQLTEFITSGSRGWAEYYASAGAIFIRSQNINTDMLDLSDAAFVNPPRSSEGARTLVNRNDLLLTITGANVGKAALVEAELSEAYVSQHVALIRPVESALSNFLHLFLTSGTGGRKQLNEEAYGAGKPGLNLQQLGAVVVPVPPPQELLEMLKYIRIHFESHDDQLKAIECALKQSVAQRRNLLKAAFNGQLVPQDASDEPASVLLERIRFERAARASQSRERRTHVRKIAA
ncbi:MAG: restriction endonuclease subunit S, partial [Telluria sp.]